MYVILKWYGWYLWKYIAECNPNKEHRILIVFNMIADMLSKKNIQSIATELIYKS